jgi:DNA-binding transcriptional ArsR family regulator
MTAKQDDPAADREDGQPVRVLDARSLRALAHPLRVRILSIATAEGPVTASGLAERLHVKTGSTSWHLSKLAEHGLIEEVEDLGTRRERWWRATSPTWSVDAASQLDDPSLAAPTTVLLAAVINEQYQRALTFLYEDWSRAWRHSWILESSAPLTLTPDDLEAMRHDLDDVIEGYRRLRRGGPDAETVVVQMQGFPIRRGQQP